VNILICPDKFKGSLTAKEVCSAVVNGISQIDPEAVTVSVPLADGGEGTCDLLTDWHEGKFVAIEVPGPRSTPVMARYGLSKNGDVAFIEMAAASGLCLLESHERDPLLTTSVGTGYLIADALGRGVRKIVLGIGGSATNDAGIGMASALGYDFCDAEGQPLEPTGENLIHLGRIRSGHVNPLLRQTEVIALCDVTNPLFGPEGAAYIYGPQKGASPSAVQILDAGLRNFRRIVHRDLKISIDFPGAGAAGGLGAGASAFLNASMRRGVNFIIENTGLKENIKNADLIITGEGRIDTQTFSGKVVSEVTRLARDAGKNVVAVCGISEITDTEIQAVGLQKIISLVDAETPPESAIQNAAELIAIRIADHCRTMLKP
jgi:glycerate kinase